MDKSKKLAMALSASAFLFGSQSVFATCADILNAYAGKSAQIAAVIGQAQNGGYGLPMWITAVDETSMVCGIIDTAGSGAMIGNSSWLGSRVISAQKATTANNFSLNAFSIATANLYGLTLPGGSLFGLQEANPVNPAVAYAGAPATWGTPLDGLVGQRVGGTNVFGGGLALYNSAKVKVGAIGVSGDTSCTDHAVAWQIRTILGLNNVPGGFISGYTPAPSFAVKGDEMIIKLSGNSVNVQNTYKQVSCAHNAINNPQAGATTGVIIEQ